MIALQQPSPTATRAGRHINATPTPRPPAPDRRTCLFAASSSLLHQVGLVFGGAQGAAALRRWVKAAQYRQAALIKDIGSGQTAQAKQRGGRSVAVDAVFFQRLWEILRM